MNRGRDKLTGLYFVDLDDTVVGADVGIDINAANKAVRGAKPMTVAQAHRFIALALNGLAAANAADEFNSAAEGVETLRKARVQLFQDIVDNAVGLAKSAVAAAESTAMALKWALYIGAGAAGVTAIGLLVHFLRRMPSRRN